MFDHVPELTAAIAAVGGALLAVSCLLSRQAVRFGVPVSLLFLIVGMLAGSDGLGGIWFDRYDLANLIGTLALVSILYSGGLSTPFSALKVAVAPAGVLATFGVMLVAGLTALGGWAFGLPWPEALLVGAIVSATDAAAVFTVLQGAKLPQRVQRTIELESGMNDPVAVILTLAMTGLMLGESASPGALIGQMLAQLAIGGAVGVAMGRLGLGLLKNVALSTPAMYPVLSLAIGMMAFGIPTWLNGSGFLSVYVAGIVIGNGKIPFRQYTQRTHDALAWLAQVGMFLMLGLLVFPSQLGRVAGTGLLLAVFVAFVARPVAVTLCLLPFRFKWREIAYISWVGLRGAMPIIMATVPVLGAYSRSVSLREALDVFDIVFFIVVVGSFLPGATVRWVTNRMTWETAGDKKRPQREPAVVEPGAMNPA